MKIILASKSPRRKELLEMIGLEFSCIVSEADEAMGEDVFSAPKILAKKKADDVFLHSSGDRIVIGCDTLVFLDEEVLCKPKDEWDAKKMLKKLQGKTHLVITGMCVKSEIAGKQKESLCDSRSQVTFKSMTDSQIDNYVATGDPLDKAGAYGVQGYGAKYIEKFEGDFYAVMGLSVSQLYDILLSLGAMN